MQRGTCVQTFQDLHDSLFATSVQSCAWRMTRSVVMGSVSACFRDSMVDIHYFTNLNMSIVSICPTTFSMEHIKTQNNDNTTTRQERHPRKTRDTQKVIGRRNIQDCDCIAMMSTSCLLNHTIPSMPSTSLAQGPYFKTNDYSFTGSLSEESSFLFSPGTMGFLTTSMPSFSAAAMKPSSSSLTNTSTRPSSRKSSG